MKYILRILKAMHEVNSNETWQHFYRLHKFLFQSTETEITYLQTLLGPPLSHNHVTEHADINSRTQFHAFLMSNFRTVLNITCFLLGDSPASAV
jgi:hypothetical protein